MPQYIPTSKKVTHLSTTSYLRVELVPLLHQVRLVHHYEGHLQVLTNSFFHLRVAQLLGRDVHKVRPFVQTLLEGVPTPRLPGLPVDGLCCDLAAVEGVVYLAEGLDLRQTRE